MKFLVYIFLLLMVQSSDKIVFEFQKNADISGWRIVNDDVMGGVSNSSIIVDSLGKGVFEGEVSLDNNGGFAMTQYDCDINNLKGYSKIVIQLKGDGKRYQFRIKEHRYNTYFYVQNFTTSGKDERIELKLSNFYPAFRGRKLKLPNFNKETIQQIAVLIGNKKEEKFKLEIDKISLE